MPYVDGFLIPLPIGNVEVYRKMAEDAGKVWMEHGALAFMECLGDDLESEGLASFRQAAEAKENETVVFSYIVFRDRAHRDEVNAKVMADPRIAGISMEGVFEAKRMAYGGFKSIVDLK